MNDLKAVPTIELINELETRQGVETGAAGLWKEYDLTRRYSNNDRHIEAELILVIRSVSALDEGSVPEGNEDVERLWRRFPPLTDDLKEFENICKEKGLTREDLKLILTSIELSEMGKAMIAEGKGF